MHGTLSTLHRRRMGRPRIERLVRDDGTIFGKALGPYSTRYRTRRGARSSRGASRVSVSGMGRPDCHTARRPSSQAGGLDREKCRSARLGRATRQREADGRSGRPGAECGAVVLLLCWPRRQSRWVGGADQQARRLQLYQIRAAWSCRRDHAVEFAAGADHMEDGASLGGRKHHRHQTFRIHLCLTTRTCQA